MKLFYPETKIILYNQKNDVIKIIEDEQNYKYEKKNKKHRDL